MRHGENRVIRKETAYARNYVNHNRELKEDLIMKRRPAQRQMPSEERTEVRRESYHKEVPHGGASRRGAVRAREEAWYRDEQRERELRARRRAIRLRKKRLRRLKRRALLLGIITAGILSAVVLRRRLEEEEILPAFNMLMPWGKAVEAPEMEELYLTINEYSRPGDKLERVKNIFVHYTANPETSALQNRSYFENLKDTHERSASAHFIIGYEGEIVQCIPLEEQAYAVMTRNGDSVSIECCYISEDGSFTRETYDSLVRLLAWLLCKYKLEPDDILRHYDCGGKLCPIYYVEHEAEWEQLKQDVADYIEEESV